MTACPMNATIENVLQEHISHLAVHSLLPPNDLMNLILDLICTAQTCIWSHWLELYRDRLPYDRADRKCAPGAHFTSRCAFAPTTERFDEPHSRSDLHGPDLYRSLWLALYRDRLPCEQADRKCAPGAHFTSRCAFAPTTGRSDEPHSRSDLHGPDPYRSLWLALYRDRLPCEQADRKCAPGAHFTSRCAFTPTTGRSDVRILQPFRITFGHQQKGEP